MNTATVGRGGKSSAGNGADKGQTPSANGRRKRTGRPPLAERNAALRAARDEDPRPTHLQLANRFNLSESRVAELLRAFRSGSDDDRPRRPRRR